MHKLKLATLAFAVLTQAACGPAESSGEASQPGGAEPLAQTEAGLDIIDIDPIPLLTCAGVSPDATLYVGNGYNIPFSALPYESRSGSGGYYYKGCGRYVVDINIGDTPSKTLLSLDPSAHDLPSSLQVGGELPGNSIDCAAYRQNQTFYKKNASNTWDTLGSSNLKGVWSNGACTLQPISGTMTSLSGIVNSGGDGWDIYRVAVSVKLRSSGQEAKVTVGSQTIIF